MNKKNSSGSGMFMMEMTVAVFFFLLCAGICVMAFVKADQMSRLAQDTNQAVMIAENMAELWKAGETGLLEEESVCTVYLDQKGGQVSAESEDAVFAGSLSQREQDGLETAEITVVRQRDQKQLFSMTAARYVPEKAE